MASRIISETTKNKKGPGEKRGRKKQGNPRGKEDNRTAEDKRVDADKWLYRDNYDELVASGTLQAHRGNTTGEIRSNYWPGRGTKHTKDENDE